MVSPYLAVKIDKAPDRHAQRHVSRLRSTRRKHTVAASSAREDLASSKEGPPGTRRAPSAPTTTPFAVRTRRPIPTCSEPPHKRNCEKERERESPKNIFTRRRISAVAKRPCLRSRSIVRSIFKGRLIRLRRNLAGEHD